MQRGTTKNQGNDHHVAFEDECTNGNEDEELLTPREFSYKDECNDDDDEESDGEKYVSECESI